MEYGRFLMFVPLSNWLRGFDRYRNVWSKELLTESKWKGVTFLVPFGHEHAAVGYGKARSLVGRLGLENDRVIALEARLPVSGSGMCARPNDHSGTGIGWVWDSETVPLEKVHIAVSETELSEKSFEEVTAMSFGLPNVPTLVSWEDCRARSFSVLPVGKACRAKCGFCFSKASVSTLRRSQEDIGALLEDASWWANKAKEHGAERAVITGGGEPLLRGLGEIRSLVSVLNSSLGKVTMITNADVLASLSLQELSGESRMFADSGLSCLAISRHGVSEEMDASIMGIGVDTARVARAFMDRGVTTRAVCVLQKNGVEDSSLVKEYVRRAAADGFSQVCFKELYVSSLSENGWARSKENIFCERNKVQLKEVLFAMEEMGFVNVGALPWGSPVFSGEVSGRKMEIAAYTEPSVGWERHHGLVRSWNLLSDGRCYASLEDESSELKWKETRAWERD